VFAAQTNVGSPLPQICRPMVLPFSQDGGISSGISSGGKISDRPYRRAGLALNSAHLHEVDESSDRTQTRSRSRSCSSSFAEGSLLKSPLTASLGIAQRWTLALIEALWQAGTSLREFARQRRVSPAAVGDQIERLRHRCPRFYRWCSSNIEDAVEQPIKWRSKMIEKNGTVKDRCHEGGIRRRL